METRLLKSQDFKLEKTTLSLIFFISSKSIITHVYFTQNVSRHPSLDQGSPIFPSFVKDVSHFNGLPEIDFLTPTPILDLPNMSSLPYRAFANIQSPKNTIVIVFTVTYTNVSP